MVGWQHPCNGHELGQTLGDGEAKRGLACYSPWGHKEGVVYVYNGILLSHKKEMELGHL